MQFNQDQQVAIEAFVNFAVDSSPDTKMMVISGPAGAGKTTITKEALRQVNNYYKTREALGLRERRRKVVFTATTNKAADVLGQTVEGVTVDPVSTVHSYMNLHLKQDPKTLKDVIVSSRPEQLIYDTLIVTDESSYINFDLFCLMVSKCGSGTRIVFLGDAAQCVAVGPSEASETTKDVIDPEQVIKDFKITDTKLPVFNMDAPVFELSKVERSDRDNPMQKVVLKLRDMILRGDTSLPNAGVNGKEVHWLERSKFDALIIQDMTSDDWAYQTSKVLAFRNKRVREFNDMVTAHTRKVVEPQVGDYMINNEYVGATTTSPSIGTDRTVNITKVSELTKVLGVEGWYVRTSLNAEGSTMPARGGGKVQTSPYFLPKDAHHKKRLIEHYRKKLLKMQKDPNIPLTDYHEVNNLFEMVKNAWVDFRPMYACTILKSQGSTFRRVFIDLGDLSTCYDLDQRNRMLYVAFSRARMQVFLTGNIS